MKLNVFSLIIKKNSTQHHNAIQATKKITNDLWLENSNIFTFELLFIKSLDLSQEEKDI